MRDAADAASIETGAPHASPHEVVLASAGAGKTYRLTGRFIGLLLSGVDPATVLATTFTRKAAGEILTKTIGRLADDPSGLRDAAARPVSAAEAQRLTAELGRRVDRLSVSTLDGFFARLIGAFRFELGLPVEPRYLDDASAEARDLRLRAIEAVLAEEADRDATLATLATLLKQLHHDTLRRSVTAALDEVVGDLYEVYRQAPAEAAWAGPRVPPGVLGGDALRGAVAELLGAEGVVPDRVHYRKSWARDAERAAASDWDAFNKDGVPAKLAAGASTFDRFDIPAELAAVYRPLVDHAAAVRLHRLARQTRATHGLLARFDACFTALREARGVMRFADATHALSRELFTADEADLADAFFRLDASVRHLLLDEFQDTSLEQWRVLRPFAEEATSQDRSFFCVGDPKQAIYGWRGGEAALFEDVMALPGLTGDARETLAESWRSSPVVLDAVNRVFGGIAGNPALSRDADAARDWAARFEPHHAAKPGLPGHATLRTTAHDDEPRDRDDDEGEDADGPGDASAHERAAAGFIAALHAAAPNRSIGVLMRGNRSAATLLYELRRRGLPVSGEGGVPLTDAAAVNAVLSALRLADHPGDAASAFHVVNSPLGEALGLDSRDPRDVDAFGRRVRASLLRDGYAATLAGWARRVRASCTPRSIRRLDRLVELAEAYDEGPADLRASRFVEHAESASVEEPASSLIRVMTIHKSKGLEFDAVVLPELDGALRFKPEVLLDRPTPTGPILAVHRAGNDSTRRLDPALTALADAARARDVQEWLCLLYVAMTRARHALHLLVEPLKHKKNGELGDAGWANLSYAAVLRRALLEPDATRVGDGEHETIFEVGDPAWRRPATDGDTDGSDGEEAAAVAARPSLGLAPSVSPRGRLAVAPSAAGRATVSARELLGDAGPAAGRARRHGALWHRLFEEVGFLDEAAPSRAALRAAALDADPALDEAALTATLAAFEQTLATPAVRDALARRGAEAVWRERPFAAHDDDGLLTGRFDRVLVLPDRGRGRGGVVIDFKTDDAAADTLGDAVEHHRPQMLAYRRAAAALLGVPVERVAAELLFTRPGAVVVVA